MARGPKSSVHPTPIPQPHRNTLHGTGQPVRPAGPQQGVDTVPPRGLSRQRATKTCEALAQTLTPPESTFDRSAYPDKYTGTRLTDVLATGGTADAGGQPPALGQAARGLEPRTQAPLPQTASAPALPVTALGGNIKATLNRAAPECAAILFEHINRLSNLARYAEQHELLAESMMASNLAGRLAIKTIEMTVGKQLNVTATITGQSSIPKWDKLTKDQQAYYKRMSEELAQLPEPDITATVVEGMVVAQTDEGYQEEPYDASTAT